MSPIWARTELIYEVFAPIWLLGGRNETLILPGVVLISLVWFAIRNDLNDEEPTLVVVPPLLLALQSNIDLDRALKWVLGSRAGGTAITNKFFMFCDSLVIETNKKRQRERDKKV